MPTPPTPTVDARAATAAAVDEALRLAHQGLAHEIGPERACKVLACLAEAHAALEPRLRETSPVDHSRAAIQPRHRHDARSPAALRKAREHAVPVCRNAHRYLLPATP